MQAEDSDGRNNDIKYSIHSGSKVISFPTHHSHLVLFSRDNFIMDPKTGDISVSPDSVLDIDQNGEEYIMEVITFTTKLNNCI